MRTTTLRRSLPLLVATAVIIGVWSAATAAPGIERAVQGVFAFTNVTVLPMDREHVLDRHTVVVRDGRIEAVGPASQIDVPAGAARIDGSGKYLMPGVAEMHAHVPGPQTPPELMEQLMFLFVANGVTTIRGMLGAPNQLELRERLARGDLLGPMFIVGAPSLNGNSAPDPETARRLVREHKAAGYDFLKLHPGLSRPVYDAIVEAAGAEGITWAGHVSAGVGIDHTIATRQSTVDHLDGYIPGAANDEVRARLAAGEASLSDVLRGFDLERVRMLAIGTREAGIWNVPTMYLWENFSTLTPPQELVRLPEMRYATPQMRAGWVQQKTNQLRAQTEGGMTEEDRRLSVEHRRTMLKALADAGAPLLMGSDAPQMFNVPGFSIHREIAVMRAAGLTPWQILESGTRNVGRYAAEIGLDGRFGTVAVGNRADLILLNANPLADVGNLADRAGVMVQGRWLPETEIQRRLEAIAAANPES